MLVVSLFSSAVHRYYTRAVQLDFPIEQYYHLTLGQEIPIMKLNILVSALSGASLVAGHGAVTSYQIGST